MPDHHNDHNQEDQENHDDCDDCKRQRAQNQKLIAIYEHLQQVQKKQITMKQSLHQHQHQFNKSVQILRSFDNKVQHIKNNTNQHQTAQFQQIGYHLYAEVLQNNTKNDIFKENQRLKLVLKNIYKQRENKIQERKKALELSSMLPEIKNSTVLQQVRTCIILPEIYDSQSIQWFNQSQKSSRAPSRKSQIFKQTSLGKSFEVSSTKTSFNTTKRKIFDKKDFQELNLWLFDDKHEVLEKELYQKNDSQIKLIKQRGNFVNKSLNFGRKSSMINENIEKAQSFRKNNSLRKTQKSIAQSQARDISTKYGKHKPKINYLQEINQNSSKFFLKRVRKGSVLPAIVSNNK